MATATDDGSFSAKTARFITWLQQLPGTSVSAKIQVADLRYINSGRGISQCGPSVYPEVFADHLLVAAEDIEEDEELFSITLSHLLAVQNSSLLKTRPGFLERLDSWNSLVLVMIHEDGMGELSHWWPYLRILPVNFDVRPCSYSFYPHQHYNVLSQKLCYGCSNIQTRLPYSESAHGDSGSWPKRILTQ